MDVEYLKNGVAAIRTDLRSSVKLRLLCTNIISVNTERSTHKHMNKSGYLQKYKRCLVFLPSEGLQGSTLSNRCLALMGCWACIPLCVGLCLSLSFHPWDFTHCEIQPVQCGEPLFQSW